MTITGSSPGVTFRRTEDRTGFSGIVPADSAESTSTVLNSASRARSLASTFLFRAIAIS
jgi:hypothetical protein